MVQPIVYQVAPEPRTFTESSEFQPEQQETIPYVQGAPGIGWPPVGFTDHGALMAAAAASNGNQTASLLPSSVNLEWVQGDSAVFDFVFTDVFWMPDDPGITDPGAPDWEARDWAAQVRNPYIYSTYAADYWVPAYGFQYNWWRGHSTVATFDVSAQAIDIPDTDPQRWGTWVTLNLPAINSSQILPGNWFRWDMQTRTPEDAVRTYLRGRARIITEWTLA